MSDRGLLFGRNPVLRTLALGIVLIACVGASMPYSWGPVLTDDVDVSEVFDPKVGSGVFMVHARVTGSTVPGNEKRDYFVLYMGQGQTLPSVRTRCRIDYRNGRVGDRADSSGRPVLGLIVEHLSCSDGKHFPDGSPRYMRP